jgi:RNA polymerase sigma-70 factor (ECF subfamily)
LSEYFKDLLEEIKKLPKRQGEVLRLFYIDDKSAQEISEQLNISVNTVYNTLSDLRKKLRKKMEDRGIQ